MRIGVAFPAYIDIWKEARELEALGFDSCWLFDSPMVYSDVYAAMALAAEHTTRITLGTAVAVARNRIAPVTAHSIATINQLAPGRVILGFATGNTARRVMGMPPVPLAEFRRECETVGAMLRGETATYREDGRISQVRLIHQRDGFVCVDPPVPLYIAAGAPKALELAGQLGDGLIVAGAAGPPLRESIARATAARKAAGVTRPLKVVAMLGVYVTAPGEPSDSLAARDALGPQILSFLRYALDTYRGPRASMPPHLAAFAAEVERLDPPRHLALYERYFIGVPERFGKFVTSEMIATMATSGPPAIVAAKVRELFGAGADEIVLWPLGNGRTLENFRRFADEVMRPMRGLKAGGAGQ
jgi:alkanesulfonate monooxygenase SsuD/methylene tetrahydromethanopterin reductase-like flavin-dependent oxidoreductase (luciferase family)